MRDLRVLRTLVALAIQVFRKLLAAAQESSPVTALQLRQAMLNSLLGRPDFPAIFEALDQALKGNISSLSGGSPPSVESVVAVPLECGDIGKQLPMWTARLLMHLPPDYQEYNFTYFQKSLITGLKVRCFF